MRDFRSLAVVEQAALTATICAIVARVCRATDIEPPSFAILMLDVEPPVIAGSCSKAQLLNALPYVEEITKTALPDTLNREPTAERN